MDTLAKFPNFTISGQVFGTELKHRIHAVSATKSYAIGTRLEDDNGDIYRYVKYGDTVLTQRLAWGYNYQYCPQSAVPATSAIGENHIHVTVGAHDGEPGSHDGAIAADELVNGYITVWHADLSTETYRIISNTAVASGGGAMIVYIDDILPLAVTAATEVVEIMACPYIDVRTGNNGGLRPFLGVPMGPGTATLCYGWIKRRGTVFIDPQAALGTAMKSQAVARHDGSIDVAIGGVGGDGYTQNMQHIGYVQTWALAGTQGAPFIYLQLE